MQSFTARMPLLTATSAFGLGRRRWSSPQQCYLHCLRTITSRNVCDQCVGVCVCVSVCVCQELLDNKPVYVDGTKIESTNFTYERPQLTIDLLREVNISFS